MTCLGSNYLQLLAQVPKCSIALLYQQLLASSMPHGMTPPELQAYARLWGLNDAQEGIHEASDYADRITEDTHFVTALMIPMPKEMAGILLAVSTGESTRVLHENMEANRRGEIIQDPHWLYFNLWHFEGMAMFNFKGITDNFCSGIDLNMKLGDFLDDHFTRMGNILWRNDFCRIANGYYLESLRQVLRTGFNAYNWLELTFGHSWAEYKGLDMYVRMMSQGMDPPDQEAHFVLNTEVPPWQRYQLQPDDWWKCTYFLSYGQKPVIQEWMIENAGMIVTNRIREMAGRRMATLLRQVRPPPVSGEKHMIKNAPQYLMEGIAQARAKVMTPSMQGSMPAWTPPQLRMPILDSSPSMPIQNGMPVPESMPMMPPPPSMPPQPSMPDPKSMPPLPKIGMFPKPSPEAKSSGL